jgi:hypothetical protein
VSSLLVDIDHASAVAAGKRVTSNACKLRALVYVLGLAQDRHPITPGFVVVLRRFVSPSAESGMVEIRVRFVENISRGTCSFSSGSHPCFCRP